MERMNIFRELFDDKIIKVLNAFLENPRKQFSLTEVSSSSKVHIATAMRILEKLSRQNVVEIILIGRSKFYRLKQSEKTLLLNKLLKNQEEHILKFTEKIKQHPRVKKIILESKTKDSAKILLVGSFLPTEKIQAIVEEMRREDHFRIQFVELSEKQFEDMKKIGLYDLDKKIIWEREEEGK